MELFSTVEELYIQPQNFLVSTYIWEDDKNDSAELSISVFRQFM